MKLYFFPTCPISNAIRILVKFCISNSTEEMIESRNDFLSLRIDSVPVLKISSDELYYNLWPVLIYLKNFHSKYIIDIFFKSSNQINLVNEIYLFYIEIYYNHLAHFSINRLYGKYQKNSIDPLKIANYLKKYNNLLKARHFLFNEYTVCDIFLFGMISTCDYFNLIDWKNYNYLFEWYLRCKSSSIFNFILSSKLEDIPTKSLFYNVL